jgi:prepilin-type N-terminal cleavage/methylation domain-containing protein
MALSRAELKSKLQVIDASAVKGRGLRRKFEQIRRKEGGFTLLELLVVVAILAAIAGTATIMLQDTDRKASAAAHVAMMDELSKGIQTFRVLNSGRYPDRWDSLLQNTTADLEGDPLAILSGDLTGSIEQGGAAGGNAVLTAAEAEALKSAGITRLRVVDTGSPCGDTLATQQAYINDKTNDVTAQNIYRIPDANGCGFADDATITEAGGDALMFWKGGANLNRVNAFQTGDTPDGVALTVDDRLVAFGVGPDSTLFRPDIIGALSNVPVYRHVEPDEYNRFIVLFKVSGVGVNGQAAFQAIVDGAGDTKDEELGELDNVRAT